jgi:hypothetical protein
MSSDTYDRATVELDKEDSRGYLGRFRDVLQSSFEQTVETVTRQSRFEISGGNVDQVDAPEDLDELVALAKEVGFVWKAFDVFAQEVWKPGYRIEAESEETKAYFMGDQEAIDASPPEDTPEGGFLSNCAIYAGEKHQDFFDLGKETTRQRRLRGTVTLERMKADPDSPESEITGWYFIRPETLSAEVYPNSNILIDPDDTEQSGVELTKRGEAAAYIQFDDNSILGQRFNGFDKDEIPLSQNDVHKQVLNPGIGDDIDDSEALEQGVFGTSEIQPVREDIAEYRNIKRNEATAISNKAHGIHFIEHGRDVLNLGNGQVEVIEWDDESMDSFESELSNIGPGGYVTHDASINVERKTGDVPDLESVKANYINDIFSALPVSKYKIGFEDDVNRDVTSEQSENDQDLITEEREYQERQWTKEIRLVAERKGLDTTGLQLKIEPEPDDSPVMSLSADEMDKLATYADALNTLAGPQAGPQALIDQETLLTDVAQLPENANSIDDLAESMDETNPDAMGTFMDAMGNTELDTLQAGEGDVVELPSGGKGVVVMEGGEDVEIDGDSVSEGEVVVAYASRQGYTIIEASELTSSSFEIDEDVEPEAVTDAMTADGYSEVDNPYDPLAIDVLVGTGIGFDSWPDSWEEADTPARVIALDAWSSMGGTWKGCFAEIGDAEICSAFKDEMLGTTEWR